MQKRAYITICTNGRYVPGVLLLNKSLEMTRSKYPLVCMCPTITGECSFQETLRAHGVQVFTKENDLKIPHAVIERYGKEKKDNWLESCYKLYIFGLERYEKLVYVDADMIIVNNIDDLFEREHMTACAAGRMFPKNADWTGLNAGLMVVAPDKNLERHLVDTLEKCETSDCNDQVVLQMFYPDWFSHEELRLPETYNLFYPFANYYEKHFGYSLEGDDPVRVVHYVGRHKPWMKVSAAVKLRAALGAFYHGRLTLPQILRWRKTLCYRIDTLYREINREVEEGKKV